MPELSAGDFLRLIENKFELAIGEVLLLLSPSLTEEQWATRGAGAGQLPEAGACTGMLLAVTES